MDQRRCWMAGRFLHPARFLTVSKRESFVKLSGRCIAKTKRVMNGMLAANKLEFFIVTSLLMG